MKKLNPWKTLKSQVPYKNQWFIVRENKVVKPNGEKGVYFYVETKPSVFIVALTEKEEVYLIKLWRYPTRQLSTELPGGNTDGMSPLMAAKKELWEETGIKAGKWIKLGRYQVWNGAASELAYTFIARDLKQTGTNQADEEGISDIIKVPFRKALKMIREGKITDSQTIVALSQAALKLGYIKTPA